MRVFGAFLVAAVLAGCGGLKNLTADEVRVPGNLRETREIPLTIGQIEQALYDHGQKCRDTARVVRNPSDPTRGYISMEMPGWSKMSVALLIDLQEKGRSTSAQAYTYYTTWYRHVRAIFAAIENPSNCG